MTGAPFANFLRTALLALTDRSKPDIMKFRGVLCDDEQPKGEIR